MPNQSSFIVWHVVLEEGQEIVYHSYRWNVKELLARVVKLGEKI